MLTRNEYRAMSPREKSTAELRLTAPDRRTRIPGLSPNNAGWMIDAGLSHETCIRYGRFRSLRRDGQTVINAFAEMAGNHFWDRLRTARRADRKDFKSGSGMFPAPVYVATYRGGRTMRVSFWTRTGKPVDYAAGFNLAMVLGRAVPISGYVEIDGQRQPDPFFESATVTPIRPRKPAANALRLRLAAIADLIRKGDTDAALQACAA